MLVEAKDTGDVTLDCSQNKQLRAHSHILAARSPVFRELLLNGKSLDLANLSEEAVQQLLTYIYTGNIHTMWFRPLDLGVFKFKVMMAQIDSYSTSLC